MKVRWLNADLTEAEVTIGFWWWTRVATVKFDLVSGWWEFAGTGTRCYEFVMGPTTLEVLLQQARQRELGVRRSAELSLNWRRPAKLPRAKLLNLMPNERSE